MAISLEGRSDWQTESVRLTVFAMPGATITPPPWAQVFDGEPDEVIRQGGMHMESGNAHGSRWMIAAQANRFDINATPQTPLAPPREVIYIGELRTSLERLASIAGRVLLQDGAIQRVAIGAVLSFPVDNLEAGIHALQGIIGLLRDIPPNSTEVLLNLNVPLLLTEPIDIHVNRLSKWQVATVQLISLGQGPQGILQMTAAHRPYVRLELDVNTTPERVTALPAGQIQALIQRLSNLVTDISQTGEFPQ
jgi:hypothetical protein